MSHRPTAVALSGAEVHCGCTEPPPCMAGVQTVRPLPTCSAWSFQATRYAPPRLLQAFWAWVNVRAVALT
jgi:hypothetical protein